MIRSSGPVLLGLVQLVSLAAGPRAQVAPGSAVVAWKPPGGAAAGGLTLVDPSGAHADLAGLDPATIGTTGLDGARSVLVTNTGVLFAGLGVDNRTGTAPVPLGIRKILLSGAAVRSDQTFATLLQVPPGQIWTVSDLEERGDGLLLVAATQVLLTANPMPVKGAFLVAPSGAAALLPLTGFPAGSLVAIADAGDRYVAAFSQSSLVVNVEVDSFGYAPTTPMFRVCRFVNAAVFGGMTLDVDGTILAGVPTSSSTIMRIPHVANATPLPVAGAPTTISVCDVLSAPGLVASFGASALNLPALSLTDTLAGTTASWATGFNRDPVAVSVRGTPASYGPASAAGPTQPFLGSFGGLPTIANTAFGLRLGATPGAVAVVLLGIGRGNVMLPFGTFLLNPARLLLPLAAVAIPNTGTAQVPLPIPGDPALRGGGVDLQALVLVRAAPLVIEMSPGLEITFQ